VAKLICVILMHGFLSMILKGINISSKSEN